MSPLWFVPWMEQTYLLQPVVVFFLKIGTYKKHRPAMGAVLFCTYEIQTTTKSLKKGVRADRFHGETVRSIEGRFLQAFISHLRLIPI